MDLGSNAFTQEGYMDPLHAGKNLDSHVICQWPHRRETKCVFNVWFDISECLEGVMCGISFNHPGGSNAQR